MSTTVPQKDLLAEGIQNMQEKNYPLAEICLRQYLKSNPDHAEATHLLAITLRKIGDVSEAEKFYREALKLDPEEANIYYNLGLMLTENKNPEGISYLQKAVSMAPEESQFLEVTANSLSELGREEEALVLYDQLLNLNPAHLDALLNLGTIYRKRGEIERAIYCYRQLLALDDKDALGHYNLGNAYRSLKKFEMAVEEYKIAISLQPDDSSAYCNLGLTYINLEQYDKALEVLRKGEQIEPDDEDIQVNIALVFNNTGETQEAIEQMERFLQRNPESANLTCCYGNALYDAKRYQQAEQAYLRAIALKPDHAFFHLNYATLLEDVHRRRDALREWRLVEKYGTPEERAEARKVLRQSKRHQS